MKNLFRLSTGIALMITILIAGACRSKKDKEQGGVAPMLVATIQKEVVIIVSSVKRDTVVYLMLFDSNGNSGEDTLLITDVMPGNKVVWVLDTLCDFEKINHIKGTGGGNIFKGNQPKDKDKLGKRFEMELGDSITCKEKYEIKLKLKKKGNLIVDPFLRVPD